jgi:acyl carrier protein
MRPQSGEVATATVDATRQRIRLIVGDVAPLRRTGAGRSSRLIADLGFDSLGLLELATVLERDLALEPLPMDELTGVQTLGELEDLVLDALTGTGGCA